MAAPAQATAHGNFPTLKIIVDTAAVLMESFSRNTKRDEDLFIGGSTHAVERALYSNPVLEMPFEGKVAAWSGLATQHAGSDAGDTTDVPGWPASGGIHGFAGDTGGFIFVDPSSKGTREGKLIDLSFMIKHFPFMGYTA